MAQRGSTVMPVLAAMKTDSGEGGPANRELFTAVGKIVGFIAIGYLFYGRWGGHGMNDYVHDDLKAEGWDWDFIDCWYFTMATLTTVGYGDMPTLSQYMRGVTIVFGLVGVLVIANSLGVIAAWHGCREHPTQHPTSSPKPPAERPACIAHPASNSG